MSRRSPARWLAPLALLAAAFALFMVISGASSDPDSSSPSGTPATTTTRTTEDPRPRERPRTTEARPRAATYEVQSGDFLSTISEKTGVSVDQIIELNPELDPQALTVGEQIKLRP